MSVLKVSPWRCLAAGVGPGHKMMLDLTKGEGSGEMDSLRCGLYEVSESSESDKSFPWLPLPSKPEVRVQGSWELLITGRRV